VPGVVFIFSPNALRWLLGPGTVKTILPKKPDVRAKTVAEMKSREKISLNKAGLPDPV